MTERRGGGKKGERNDGVTEGADKRFAHMCRDRTGRGGAAVRPLSEGEKGGTSRGKGSWEKSRKGGVK